MRRYAQGRVTHFLSRQILTLSGAISLVFLVSPRVGLMSVLIALTGELIDVLVLRQVPRWLDQGKSVERVYALTAALAGLQAATIAICVNIAWFSADHGVATFFALAYLTGAAINGGLVLPFHRRAALVRLAVYGGTVVGLFALDLIVGCDNKQHFMYDMMGAMIMVYMVKIFVEFSAGGHQRHFQNSRDLLVQSRTIANAMKELREQQKEARNLSLVAKNAHDSVIMSDAEGYILWVNAAFSRITGYSAAEAIGLRPSDLLNGPESSQEVSTDIANAIGAGRSHRAEILNYTKSGEKIWVEVNLVPILGDDGQVEMVVAIERDITDAKAHEAELAEATMAAETGERSKAEFLATMSHEIRTPMNGIIGMADLLAESELNPDQRLYADTIRSSADALLTIINDILDFSKLDAGKLWINPVGFDLRACVYEAVTLLRPQAQSKGLYLDLKLGRGLPSFVWGDDGRLRQILVNVIGNAVKFTEFGGVTVSVECAVASEGYEIAIRIQDSGIGIPADRLDSIFDQFAQADAATTRRFGGTGLGLTISRLLARAMGGDIIATSTVGKGTCFVINLELGLADSPANEPVTAPRPTEETAHLAGLTVLVAEDNGTNRLLIRKYLQNLPIDLHFAKDGIEAIEMTAEHLPDFIFMDMSMPRMDGLEATRNIRAKTGPQPYIIALTANAFASDEAACRAAGMDEFLSKPVRKQQLIDKLAAFGMSGHDMPDAKQALPPSG